jgi:histidinol-phosphatase (PHP family)
MHLAGDDEPFSAQSFGRAHIERYLAQGAEVGVDEIGFTDHVYRFSVARDWLPHAGWVDGATEDLETYVTAVGTAREDGLAVKLGLEVDWVPGREREIGALRAAHDWDYLLGSYHWLGEREIDHPANSVWEGSDPDEIWDRYVHGWCDAARSGLYDSMAHPDLAKVFGYRADPEPLDLYLAMGDAAAAGGVCIEISTAGLRKPVGEIYPAPMLLAVFRDRGVPITLGSDTHAPAGVGAHFDRARGLARAAGYRTLTRFHRFEREQVEL